MKRSQARSKTTVRSKAVWGSRVVSGKARGVAPNRHGCKGSTPVAVSPEQAAQTCLPNFLRNARADGLTASHQNKAR